MPQMIDSGKEMLRINPQTNVIEYSRDSRNWVRRCSSKAYGTFKDLCLFGPYVYAVTSKGICFSRDNGTNWTSKCVSRAYGEFQTLMAQGTELYAQTTKGLYMSKDNGTNWIRK